MDEQLKSCLVQLVHRGMVLRDLNWKETTVEQFVAENEAADEKNVIEDDLNEAVVVIDILTMIMTMIISREHSTKSKSNSTSVSVFHPSNITPG